MSSSLCTKVSPPTTPPQCCSVSDGGTAGGAGGAGEGGGEGGEGGDGMQTPSCWSQVPPREQWPVGFEADARSVMRTLVKVA